MDPKTEIEQIPTQYKGEQEIDLRVSDKIVVTFDLGNTKPGQQENVISRQQGRKHILPDRFGERPVPGVQYTAKITKDTGSIFSRGGAFIAKIAEPTEFGRKQLELIDDGFQYLTNFSRTKPDGSKIETIDEADDLFRKHVLQRVLDRGYDIKVLPFGKGDNITPDPRFYSIFIKYLDRETVLEPQQEPEKERAMQILPLETIGVGKLRVLNLEVTTAKGGGKRIPSEEKFKYYTLDQKTAELLYRIASAWERRSPFFVEGGTATSKTSAAEFFAYLIDADVYRLNLSGQTDTSELIGRFVPNDGSAQIAFDERISGWNSPNDNHREEVVSRLTPHAQSILKRAHDEHRELTKPESIEVARSEGLHISDTMWVWKNGMIPEAMIHGGIVILDEATLGQPEILERLNPVLEYPPSLLLSENGGIIIGPGGDHEVHPDFWIMGTGNPASMSGRTPFSEAFQRRLADYFVAPEPTRDDYEAMLRYLVLGKSPEIDFGGAIFKDNNHEEPPFGFLREVSGVQTFLKNLAAFHEDMTKITDPATGAIGKDRRRGGKYVITRQNLLSVLQFMASEKILDINATIKEVMPVYSQNWAEKANLALQRFYVDPLQPDDRLAARDAMLKYPVAEVLGQQSLE